MDKETENKIIDILDECRERKLTYYMAFQKIEKLIIDEIGQLEAGVSVPGWYDIRITKNQLEYIKLICRFHTAESKNPKAIQKTKKLLWCLNHWAKEAH